MHRRQFCLFVWHCPLARWKPGFLTEILFPFTFFFSFFFLTFTLVVCTLRNSLEDPPALPWMRTITSSAMRGSVYIRRKKFFFYNIVSHLLENSTHNQHLPDCDKISGVRESRLQRGRLSRGCAATEDRPASLRHHLTAGLHTVGGYTHAAICDITISIDHYGDAGWWMIMITNVSLRHHHAFFRRYYMIVAAAVGGEAGFAPTTAGRFDWVIHAYRNAIVGQVFGTDFYGRVFANDG